MFVVMLEAFGAIRKLESDDRPEASWMASQIGNWCELIEVVRTDRLPDGYIMVVDEEGLLKPNMLNEIGSWIYKMDIHGNPIAGDVLIIKENYSDKGPVFSGMTEDEADWIISYFEEHNV